MYEDLFQYFQEKTTIDQETFNIYAKYFKLINKTIETDIAGSKNFVWNITLSYTMDKKFVER